MSSIPSSINTASAVDRAGVIARVGPQGIVASKPAPETQRTKDVDEVTLSSEALAASDNQAPGRAELLAQIKAQIEAGTYDSDDKLTIVADRLARKLG